jgi:hypothetical protein
MAFTEWQTARLAHDSYVLAEAALVYMATPKVACTSLKHAVAALHGVDFGLISQSLTAAKVNELAIHDRGIVRQPSLLDISEHERADLLGSPEALRFCVVRDPFRRLASAWLDCILCHSLSPIAPILRFVEFPKYVPDWTYLSERFSEFVKCLYDHDGPNFSNHHWQRQCDLLLPDLMNYSLVARLEDLSAGLTPIIEHLQKRNLTWPGLPRFNETPVKYSSRLYTAATARKVAAMYAADFAKYGYPTVVEPGGHNVTLPPVEFVEAIQKRNQRIFHLSLKVRGLI